MTDPKRPGPNDPADEATQTGPFQCQYCGRTFDTREELLLHERTHRGEEVGAPGSSAAAAGENAGNLSDRGNQTVPWGEERRRWTTGSGDREEGEMTGRETPGGRNAGFSSD